MIKKSILCRNLACRVTTENKFYLFFGFSAAYFVAKVKKLIASKKHASI